MSENQVREKSNKGKAMRVWGLVIATTLAAAANTGCSGCSPPVGASKTGSISGVVLKSAVEGATVTAFAVDASGRRADSLGTATTDAAGAFTIDIGEHAGATLVCAAEGRFVDEASNALVQVGPIELCRLVDNVDLGTAVKGITVTPWTSLHAELSACFVELGRDANVTAASEHAAFRLNDFLGAGLPGYDLLTTVPTDVTTTTGLSLSPEAWAGLLSAGLSQTSSSIAVANDATPGVRFTAVTLADKLRQDLAGGCLFDGAGTGGSALAEGVVPLTADTLRGAPQGLATSIAAFLTGDRNASGITTEDVQDLLRRLADHQSEIFAESANQTDLDKPVLTFVEPAPNATRGGVVRVEVTGVDASEIDTFAFTAPAQATFTAAEPTCVTDETGTTCTLVGNLNTSLAPIVDGPVVISVTATDAAGNTQTADLTFTANNSLPVITVTAPPADAVVNGTRTITATATDADGITSLTVDIPGVGVCSSEPGAAVVDIEPATGSLSCQWDTTRTPEGRASLTFHAVDGAGQTADLPHVVQVDNNAFSTITGFVDIGSPVAAATVTALDWSGRVRGAELGSATTSATGAFSITLDDTDHASVLLVVTGGTFVDLATGGTFAIADGQELTSAVAAVNAGDNKVVNVNAWTTLAAARATHTPSVADDAFVITTNVNLLSQHLRRVPLGAPFSVATTKSADLTTETVTIADQRAVLALSHAALSRLAAETSVAAGVAVGTVTAVELVRVLALDLSTDPLLDGSAEGSVLTVGPDDAPLTSLTTRFDLASSLDRWLAEAPLAGANVDRNSSSITRVDALNGRLFEALAEDNRGDLYPDAGRPFDVDPPSIDLSFGGVNQGAVDGASLRGSVQINGAADDEAGDVVVFGATLTADGSFIPDDDTADSRLRVFIGTNVLPNSAEAAEACINAPDALDAAELEDAVCVCAIAEDEQANVAESILCFTRPLPAVAFTAPSPSNAASVTGATTIAAQVTTGFDLASFDVVGAASSLTTTRPTPDTLQVTVPTSFVDPVNNPNIVVELRATDIAGRTTPASLTFTRPAPTVAFEAPSPANGASLTGPTTIAVRATSGYDLASFGVSGAVATLPLTRPTADTLQFTVPTSFVDATNNPNIVVNVAATDVAGRTAPATLTFTRPAPSVSFEPPSPAAGASVAGAATVVARVASGYDVSSFAFSGATAALPSTRPTADTIQVVIPTSFVDAVNKPNIVVNVNATDVAGRAAPASLTFTRAAPTTSISAPTAGAVFTTGQQVQLAGAATGGYDLQTCTATLTSSPAVAAPALPAPVRSGTSCTFAATLATTAINDATWTLTMAATDVAGRVAPPTTRTFIVDDTAPSVSALTLTGVTRTINTVGADKFIGADNPAAPAPRVSTYTAAVTATDNFAVSRVVFRLDAPDAGADTLVCVDGVAGACSSQTAVVVNGPLKPCITANNCTIGGTKVGNVYTAQFADARADGARTISVEVYDVNGNDRTDGASAVLNKDSVAPVFTWKPATLQDTWHDMSPTAAVQLCRTVDNGTDFRSSCRSKPAAVPVSQVVVRDNAFFVGSTPTTPTQTMHVWRNLIRASAFETVGVSLPTATAATVGDGTISVKYQAGTTCPSATTLSKSKGLTNGGFALNLATEDLGFDLVPINNARVCLRAVPVDAAGNEGTAADIFVKWDTVDPPLNVLVNPPDDADALPQLAFSTVIADARAFITSNRQVSIFHTYISNPYTFAEKVKLSPTADLVVDIEDTMEQTTQKSNLRDRWPGNANIVLESPASTALSSGAFDQSWTTTGLAANDSTANNQVFVKITTDSAQAPRGTKVADTAPSVGVVTRNNTAHRIDRTMAIDGFSYFTVSSAGAIGAQIFPDAAGFITVPAATTSGLLGTTTASVVVAVAFGKVAAGSSYAVAAPGEAIPVMLRGVAGTGVDPDDITTTTRFVVLRHPIFNAGLGSFDVEGLSGLHLHAQNGDGTSGSPLVCSSGNIASRAKCTFYKRWFELAALRLVWNVGDGTTLKKPFTLSTKDAQNTVYTFNNDTALVPMHPFWEGFEDAQQVLRSSTAP